MVEIRCENGVSFVLSFKSGFVRTARIQWLGWMVRGRRFYIWTDWAEKWRAQAGWLYILDHCYAFRFWPKTLLTALVSNTRFEKNAEAWGPEPKHWTLKATRTQILWTKWKLKSIEAIQLRKFGVDAIPNHWRPVEDRTFEGWSKS